MINPALTSTIRTGELPSAPFSLTDKIPHEIGIDLKSGTVQQLVDLISTVINVSGGVGFRSVSVTDGQTLPTTTKEEFILVGKGTYFNVQGGETIVLTKELNALVSNGSFWFIGVEIPINVELAGITQFIREGFTTTTPSEDAVFKALKRIPKTQFISNGIQSTYDIGVLIPIVAVFWNGALLNDNDWTQSGTNFTLTFIPALGELIKPI